MSNIQEFRGTAELLETVIPLGFVRSNKQLIHNMCLILQKTLNPQKVRYVFDDPSNAVVCDLLMQMLRMWVEEYADSDSFILSTLVELLEMLLHSQRFWQALRHSPMTTSKLINISKRQTINALVKTKIVQIVSIASKQ